MCLKMLCAKYGPFCAGLHVLIVSPETCFSKGFRARVPNIEKINEVLTRKIMNHQIRSQFCICHDSSAVMACAKLWTDMIIRNKITLRRIFVRFQLRAHSPIVKQNPDLYAMPLTRQSSSPHKLPSIMTVPMAGGETSLPLGQVIVITEYNNADISPQGLEQISYLGTKYCIIFND